ncbi:MAG: hypothetical protein V1694_01165 [Candidatus Eisenbacteria bacterium]
MPGGPQKAEVEKAIAEFCLKIIQEPLTYFSEADCQQLLVEELKKVECLRDQYRTSVRRGQGSKGRYTTALIHREYGGGGATRIDVVVFSPDDVKRIDSPNLMIGSDYLDPVFALELGTEKTADTAAHLKNDLAKLGRKVKDTGYILHFYRDTAVARTGTRRRQRTEEKIGRIFKSAFAEQESTGADKVKILPILIRTGRDQARMRGKCEIFDGLHWNKVNVSRPDHIRRAILDRLK